jgi:hypothetical protein
MIGNSSSLRQRPSQRHIGSKKKDNVHSLVRVVDCTAPRPPYHPPKQCFGLLASSVQLTNLMMPMSALLDESWQRTDL